MDLTSQMLIQSLSSPQSRLRPVPILPSLPRVARRLPGLSPRAALNLDRLLGRFGSYPLLAAGRRASLDFFHVADHSYGQLVHALPARRTGVYCYDLEAFRCLLEPGAAPKPAWYRAMMKVVLSGIDKAALVFYSSKAIGAQIDRFGLFRRSRKVLAPLAAAPEFRAEPSPQDSSEALLARLGVKGFVLHVGRAEQRKRLDVLIRAFARVAALHRDVVLLQRGAEGDPGLLRSARELGISERLVFLPPLDRATLAGLYRRARVVALPSDAEGFGLPAIEALSSGGVLLASDIPVLKEVAGVAGLYCPVGDVPAWAAALDGLLAGTAQVPSLEARISQAAAFSWRAHAEAIVNAYLELS